ncbi:hypothetical protein CANINC_001077 [Pichia inconspicua]|uniref:BSD domain-containing protein n=1 Tax=Pichia inconspicua TaxID=52247 RepID=A0A4T0X503_9ASCO|nr:hypothetical protein CANINC_001077 [[Candida] inconspicua]
MAKIQGHVTHKKRAGMMTIDEDAVPATLVWKCVDPNAPTNLVELSLDTVAYLKATPESSDKMMLKLGLDSGKEYLFGFNSRQMMDEMKHAIQQIIARKKTSINLETENSKQSENANADVLGSSKSPTSESSNKVSESSNETVKNDQFLAELLDSDKLIKNLALQQKLLRDNMKLMRTFTEAVIKEGMEAEEFWKSRIHLLRSFAIQNNQKKGPYNVLSTIKPVASSDNEVNVNVTRDKIKEIFKQYPIVRKAYDDNVPRMSEGEFWSRFFSSKLFRKLRGEKINLYDRGDVTLDKYLYFDPDYDGEEEVDEDEHVENLANDEKADDNENKNTTGTKRYKKVQGSEKMVKKRKVKLFNENHGSIPKCLDLEGNKEDDSQLKGNKPDITMKDDQDPELVGILKTMNRLSRRLMAEITEQENQTDDLDKEFEKELELQDLDDENEIVFNELKYVQKSNISNNIIPLELREKVIAQSNMNPESNEYDEIISKLKKSFDQEFDLTCVYTNMKKEGKKQNDAYKDINAIVKQNSKQSQQSWNNNLKELLGLPSNAATSTGVTSDNTDYDIGIKINLENTKIESVKLTHATSIEFLKQFWTQFNITGSSTPATDPNFKSDLIKLRKYYFSIKNCLTRVEAQLNSCTNEQEKKIETRLLQPLIESLNCAMQRYEDAIVKSK